MTFDLLIDGKIIKLERLSDQIVAERVYQQMKRRLMEDDWRPYRCQADALLAWSRLGGIRVQVLKALDLI